MAQALTCAARHIRKASLFVKVLPSAAEATYNYRLLAAYLRRSKAIPQLQRLTCPGGRQWSVKARDRLEKLLPVCDAA